MGKAMRRFNHLTLIPGTRFMSCVKGMLAIAKLGPDLPPRYTLYCYY